MGNHWLSGKRRRNNQTATIVWLVQAHLLLLPSVKVSDADGGQHATIVLVVSRELVAAAQLQLVNCRAGLGLGKGRETPGSDPLDKITISLFLDFYWGDASVLQHEGTVRPVTCPKTEHLFVNEHTLFDKNIARGTMDPGYWLFNLIDFPGRNKCKGGFTCISSNFGHHVALLALVVILASKWRYLLCL